MNTEILVRMVFFNVLSVEIDNLLKKHLAIYLKLLSMNLLKKMFTAKYIILCLSAKLYTGNGPVICGWKDGGSYP